MKSQMLFLQQLLEEFGQWCCTSTSQDFKTILARVEQEGFSFLTITLPSFGKDFERSLDQGYVDRSLFTGFQWKGGLPRLFGGFLGLVFDRASGRLVDEPSIVAIYAVRQLTLLFGKIELPCSDTRVSRAIERYIDCEQEVKDSDRSLVAQPYLTEAYHRLSSLLFRGVFTGVDRRVYYGEITPRVSSGATAERLRGNAKYVSTVWHRRLDRYFPHWEFLRPFWRSYVPDRPDFDILEPGMERPVRVITVPKTLKTPRIIAIEPFCMQYVQQGILEALVEEVRADDIARTFISWESQIPNQELAREGSKWGSLATLDLSEASDRVSNRLVKLMLSNHPHLARGVDDCRSRRADVPGHGVIRLAKFASMGSALCFPMESMVFCTLVFLGIERELNRQLSLKDIKSFKGQVRIYGDDIIVPVRFVRSVVSVLQDFGLVVNESKSFWTGKFRESCGKDYYDGYDVSVVKVRAEFPTKRRHVREIESIVSLRNQLYKSGFRSTCDFLDSYIGRLIPFPYVGEFSPALGRIREEGHQTDFWDSKLQRPLVRAAVATHVIPSSRLDSYGALLKFFLKRSEEPLERQHLVRAGRPESVDIKIRKVSAV